MKYFYNGDGYTVSFSDDDRMLYAKHDPKARKLPMGRGGFTWDVEGQLIAIHGPGKELADGSDAGNADVRDAIYGLSVWCQAYGRPKFERDFKVGRRAVRRKQRAHEVKESVWPQNSSFNGHDPREAAQALVSALDKITENLLTLSAKAETVRAQLVGALQEVSRIQGTSETEATEH